MYFTDTLFLAGRARTFVQQCAQRSRVVEVQLGGGAKECGSVRARESRIKLGQTPKVVSLREKRAATRSSATFFARLER